MRLRALLPALLGLALLALLAAAVWKPKSYAEPEPLTIDLHADTGAPENRAVASRTRPVLLRLDLTGLSSLEGYEVEIDDVLGVRVLREQLSVEAGKGNVRVPILPGGTYYVHVMSARGVLLRWYAFRVLH